MEKRLYRSRKDRMIAGVCGGLAEYLDVDPTLIRLLWILISLPGAVGVPMYILAWILVPQAPVNWAEWRPAGEAPPEEAGTERPAEAAAPPPPSPADRERERERRTRWAGAVLLVLGGLFLVNNLFPWVDLGRLWPVALIAVGVVLLLRGRRSG
ncbi:MAG TPA: PspC domain-containing protein [Firmicutes bacterium]|nr:PspC domain-containing protein [Bacillota bacterium]